MSVLCTVHKGARLFCVTGLAAWKSSRSMILLACAGFERILGWSAIVGVSR
jgi:hypothetical protein